MNLNARKRTEQNIGAETYNMLDTGLHTATQVHYAAIVHACQYHGIRQILNIANSPYGIHAVQLAQQCCMNNGIYSSIPYRHLQSDSAQDRTVREIRTASLPWVSDSYLNLVAVLYNSQETRITKTNGIARGQAAFSTSCA